MPRRSVWPPTAPLLHPQRATMDPDSFTYTVKDSAGADSNIATVTITITAPANDPPVANGDSITVSESGTTAVLVGGAGSVKANDTDTEDGVPGGDVTLGTGPGNASSFSLGRRRHLLLHPQRVDYGPGLVHLHGQRLCGSPTPTSPPSPSPSLRQPTIHRWRMVIRSRCPRAAPLRFSSVGRRR